MNYELFGDLFRYQMTTSNLVVVGDFLCKAGKLINGFVIVFQKDRGTSKWYYTECSKHSDISSFLDWLESKVTSIRLTSFIREKIKNTLKKFPLLAWKTYWHQIVGDPKKEVKTALQKVPNWRRELKRASKSWKHDEDIHERIYKWCV